MRIAIVSDLHVGPAACSPALRPNGPGADGDKDYVPKLLKVLKKSKLAADYLLCPGDLSDLAEPAEFLVAEQVLLAIAQQLGVSENRIIALPGNHDVHWGLVAAAKTAAEDQKQVLRFQTMSTTGSLGPAWKASSPGIFGPPFCAISSYKNLLVLSFTTSAHDDKDQLLHYGRIAKDTLAEARSLLATAANDKRAKILLLHHHPVVWDTPGSEQPDPSVLVNAEALLELAHDAKFDFLIHGHKHHPRFRVLSQDSLHPLVVLSAGTFSRRIDTDAAGVSANQFHLLEVQQRDPSSGMVPGRLVSWAWVPGLRQWVPSDEASRGIAHIEVFGQYVFPAALTSVIEPLIKTVLSTQTHCYWSDLYAHDSNLSLCGLRLVKQVLADVAQRNGCRLHGDELADLLLVKG